MNELQEKNVIVHANAFAYAIDKKMDFVEQRMLAIYLSKLNPNDTSTRKVVFSLHEYKKILGLKRYNITKLQQCAKKIINTPVIIRKENGGFLAVNVFSTFELDYIKNEWVIVIDCSDRVLPYLFDLKKEFIKYELWNILNLNEMNHQQMYRILKQYEKIGHKKLELQELKMNLGLQDNSTYSEYKRFREKVLEPCKKSIIENTDIYFEYQPIRKGRSIHSINFTIKSNQTKQRKLLLSDFVESCANKDQLHENNQVISSDIEIDKMKNLSIQIEFNQEQLQVLVDCVRAKNKDLSPEQQYDYLVSKYNEMCMRKPERSRFLYLKKIIDADTIEQASREKTSYDINVLDKFWDKVPKLD